MRQLLAFSRNLAAAAPNLLAQVTAIMGQLAKNVPMHTWLAALPQLISRVCHPCKEVSELAKSIIVRITQVRALPRRCLGGLFFCATPARRYQGLLRAPLCASHRRIEIKGMGQWGGVRNKELRAGMP